jgi:hypothetical protein
MFCSFAGKPLIVRLYGQGQVVRPQDPDWANLHTHFPSYPGERQIVLLNIESIMSTCGFAVPLYEYQGEGDDLIDFATNMRPAKMDDYRRRKNQQSRGGQHALPTDQVIAWESRVLRAADAHPSWAVPRSTSQLSDEAVAL